MLKIINNTKISITSLKTGKETIILDTDYDSETHKTGNVVAGIPLTECVDNSLDSFVITYKGGSKELFTPYELVVFEINDGLEKKEYRMCIQSDRIQSYQPKYMNYTHTVFLIELTKLLEKIIVFSLNLTNPKDTLSDQFEKACINAEPVVTVGGETVNSRRLFLSDSLKSLLSGAESEDFWFSNTDMRTVFDTMLSRFNCRCTVENVTLGEGGNITEIYIGYRSLSEVKTVTPIWTEEENGVIVNEEQTIDGQNFAGRLRGRGYNTYSTIPVTVKDMFKSDSGSINDNNAMISLPFPIGENGFDKFIVHNVEIRIKIYDEDGKTDTVNTKVDFDIADFFVPADKYTLLEEASSISNDYYQKCYSIGYTIGEKNIYVSQYTNSIGGIVYKRNILNAVNALAHEYATNNYNKVPNESVKIVGDLNIWFNWNYTAVYKPIIDTIVDMEKPGVYDKDYAGMAVLGSQTANNLDELRHGKQALSDIRRTGNAEWYIDVSAKYFSKLLPLMSKITDKYVVYKREIGVYDRFVKCRYYLSKDYNTVEQNAGIRRERHLYDIPIESDECPIIVKQYLMFSDTAPTLTATYFKESCLKSIFDMDGNFGSLKYLLFESFDPDGAHTYPKDTEYGEKKKGGELFPWEPGIPVYRPVSFIRPTANYAQGKTLHFAATLQDNYSVDYSRAGYIFSIFGDKGNMITYNRYVSNSERYAGECSKFELLYIFSLYDNSKMDYFPIAKTEGVGLGNNKFSVMYWKDRTQTPYFELQIECAPTEAAYGEIVIGTKFCNDNALLRELTEEEKKDPWYFFFSSTEKLDDAIDSIDINKWEKRNPAQPPYEIECHTALDKNSNEIIGYVKFKVNETAVPETSGAWCIADKNGNIILGKNFTDGNRDIYVYLADKKE